jgi:putative MATE family efflux protein
MAKGGIHMQRLRETLRPYLGDGAFYRSALAVMLPVTVQQLINNMFNVVDNLMVGSLDVQGLAMSAVSVANKPIIVFNGFIFGLAGAGGLLISQYFGARDRKACMGIFWSEMAASVLSAAFFFALLFGFPQTIMRLFVTDPRTVELGVQYMRIVSFSYFPVAVSSVCVFSLRSLGQNRMSMFISLASMGVNALFNYLLIFGSLGFPRLGVEGAAWGTLIARLFEMSFYLTLMLRKRMYYSFEPGACMRMHREIRRRFFCKAKPLIINELLYCIGINIFFWCYARMDETALPAVTIAELCFQVSAVIVMGNSSAVSVLIGTELGAGALDKARQNSRKLMMLTLGIGFISTAVCIGLAFLLPLLYNVSDTLRHTATQISCLMAVFAPINFIYAYCFFCLRAGGDTRNATKLDSGFLWAVPVPACLLIGLLFPGRLPMIVTVVMVQVLINVRIFPALHVLKKGTWIRNITREGDS